MYAENAANFSQIYVRRYVTFADADVGRRGAVRRRAAAAGRLRRGGGRHAGGGGHTSVAGRPVRVRREDGRAAPGGGASRHGGRVVRGRRAAHGPRRAVLGRGATRVPGQLLPDVRTTRHRDGPRARAVAGRDCGGDRRDDGRTVAGQRIRRRRRRRFLIHRRPESFGDDRERVDGVTK